MGGIGLSVAVVEVACADLFRGEVECESDAGHDVFDNDHALRTAKAPEGGVGGGVRFADPAFEVDVRKVVGVVEMEEGAVVDREGKVKGPAPIGKEMDLHRINASVVLIAHLKACMEGVSFSRGGNVVIAVELQGDGLLELVRGEGADAGPRVRLRFLPAKAASHAGTFDRDAVAWPAEHFSDDGLGLGGMLG